MKMKDYWTEGITETELGTIATTVLYYIEKVLHRFLSHALPS